MTQQTSSIDRKAIRAAEKAAKLSETERLEGLSLALGNRNGRRWLWAHLADCGVFTQTFTGDALTSAFNEGKRSLGLGLLNDIVTHFPETYVQMMREANERTSSDDARRIAPGGHANRADRPDEDSGGLGDGPDYAEADGA